MTAGRLAAVAVALLIAEAIGTAGTAAGLPAAYVPAQV
jgi:hypothetical protein